jgi:uncharacterized repeat protein (TIGR01451 family)
METANGLRSAILTGIAALALTFAPLYASASGSGWTVGAYELHTAALAENVPADTEGEEPPPPARAPMLAADLGDGSWLGALYGDDPNGWAYELFDAEAGEIIRRVTVAEALGSETGEGCSLVSDERPDPDTAIARYEIEADDYKLVLTRTIKAMGDPNLSAKRRLVVLYDVANLTFHPISLRFAVRQFSGADVARAESGALLSVLRETEADHAAAVYIQSFTGGSGDVTVEVGESDTDAAPTVVTWAAQPVARKLAQPRVEVGVVNVTVTTADGGLAPQEAENVAAYFDTGRAEPRLAATVTVDKQEAYPGDVLEYRLRCVNIGTGPAVDGAVSDPVPDGVEYVLGSATGDGAGVTYSVDGGESYDADIRGDVTHIRWAIEQPILPGDAIEVSFRARVLAR